MRLMPGKHRDPVWVNQLVAHQQALAAANLMLRRVQYENADVFAELVAYEQYDESWLWD